VTRPAKRLGDWPVIALKRLLKWNSLQKPSAAATSFTLRSPAR
jgi:hypothetical protein